MKILILGGTRFLGPALVEEAQDRGHELTLFNRGRSAPQMFAELPQLRGDRNPEQGDGLRALEHGNWDAVIDTSGYLPQFVRASAELLAPRVGHYLFISTLSVYADRNTVYDENAPVLELPESEVGTERVTGVSYGPLKALCESAAESALPGRTTVLRPGLIVGPRDNSDRFTWWPFRVARGGRTVAPGAADAPIQVIDVRDLAAFAIRCLEDGHDGIYNVIGPRHPVTMEEFLYGSKVVLGSDNQWQWLADDFLLAQGVGPYVEMPLWIPRQGPPYGRAVFTKALEHGLQHRPLGETIADTFVWQKTRAADHRWRAGLTPERENALLATWDEQRG